MENEKETEVMELRAEIIKKVLIISNHKALGFVLNIAKAAFRNSTPVTEPSTEDLNHAIQAIGSLIGEDEAALEKLMVFAERFLSSSINKEPTPIDVSPQHLRQITQVANTMLKIDSIEFRGHVVTFSKAINENLKKRNQKGSCGTMSEKDVRIKESLRELLETESELLYLLAVTKNFLYAEEKDVESGR